VRALVFASLCFNFVVSRHLSGLCSLGNDCRLCACAGSQRALQALVYGGSLRRDAGHNSAKGAGSGFDRKGFWTEPRFSKANLLRKFWLLITTSDHRAQSVWQARKNKTKKTHHLSMSNSFFVPRKKERIFCYGGNRFKF
jgi:hypothetical protein